MYVIVAGGGKIGANVTRSLLRLGNEVTLIEQRRDRFEALEDEFEHQVQRGDATELFVLEKAGIARPPDIVLALTGDDEDNMIIGQIAREKYGVPKVIARVNDPRNQSHFDLLGISPTICATSSVMALVEHEVPEHDLIHLLELRGENLEIVEVQIDGESPSAGRSIEALSLPEGSRLISVMRGGRAEIAVGLDGARGRRPGACDPRARQGGRATSRPASSLALILVAGDRPHRLRAAADRRRRRPRRAARRSRLRARRLDALRLGRAPQQRRPERDRDHAPRTSARSSASRCICRARSTPPRSTCTA